VGGRPDWRAGSFGRDGIPIATSPFAKVQSISSVYFPQFNHQVIELASAVDLYRDWIYRAAKKRTDHPIDRTATERGVDALMPYVEKREALLDALKTFAHEEFQ